MAAAVSRGNSFQLLNAAFAMRMMSVKGSIGPFFSLRAAGPFHPRAFSTSAPILYSNSARIAVSYSSHLQKRSYRLHPTWKLNKQHAHFTAPRKPLNKLAVDGGEAVESSCQLTWQILGANPTGPKRDLAISILITGCYIKSGGTCHGSEAVSIAVEIHCSDYSFIKWPAES